MAEELMIQCEDLVYEYAREQQRRTQTSSSSAESNAAGSAAGTKAASSAGSGMKATDAAGGTGAASKVGAAVAETQAAAAEPAVAEMQAAATEPAVAETQATAAEPTSVAEAPDAAEPEAPNATEVIRALDGVTFSIRRGEFTAVIGKNGSGKTTLAKCLNALYLPASGKVLVNGMDTRNDDVLWNIRQTAGMVFQDPDNQLVSSIVEDDVAFGPENLGLPPKEIRKRVDDALKLVGMSDSARRAPNMLSGGQKQRVAIAGVIAMQPECIIFDEPTAMLDPQGRKEVMDIVTSLKKQGITIILITHFMDEAVRADRVLVLDKGRIIKEGTPKQIFTDKEVVKDFDADLPCGAAVANSLRAKGLDVPEDIVTDEELLEFLLERKAGAAENGGVQH